MEYEDKDYEDFDMFNTDRDIVKEYINFKKEVEVPRPMLRDGCNLDEFKSFTLLWRLYAECHDEMDDRERRQQLLRCIEGPL